MPPVDWRSSTTSGKNKAKTKHYLCRYTFSLQLRDQITARDNHTKGEYLQIVNKKKEPFLFQHTYPWKLGCFGKCSTSHLKATGNWFLTFLCFHRTIIKLICIWFWLANELQWTSLGPRASGVLCVTMPRDRCPAAAAPAPARPRCSNGNFLREDRIVFFLFLFLGIYMKTYTTLFKLTVYLKPSLYIY